MAAAIFLLLAYLLMLLGALGAWVLAAVAVYNDAKAGWDGSAVMWGLLVGFLGLIPLIIYLAMRSGRRSRRCPQCGMFSNVAYPYCPYCARIFTPYDADPATEPHRRRVRPLTIAAGSLLVAGIVIPSAFLLLLAVSAGI